MSKQMADRYKLAEQIVWNRLAKWKKVAITEDRETNPQSRHLSEFAKEVIKLAESNDELIVTPNKISDALTIKNGKFYATQSN